MKNIKQILEESDNMLKKGVNTGSLSGETAGSSNTLRVRQDLDGTIVNISNRNTPFYDMVAKTQGQGSGLTFNMRQAIFLGNENPNPREAIYADGGLPKSRTSQYYQKTVAYVAVGYDGSVTGLAESTAETLTDLYATEVEATTRTVVQAMEWLSFWGTDNTANTGGLYSFPGLDELITTNVYDAGGVALAGTAGKKIIDQAANLVAQRGGTLTHMFTSIRTGININNTYNGNERVIISNTDNRQNITWGNQVAEVSTVAGMVKIVPDFFINPGNTYPLANGSSSFPSGATTSTAFLLNMNYIELRFLKKLGFQELGRVADKREFFVNAYLALKLVAEPYMAKIINIGDTIQ